MSVVVTTVSAGPSHGVDKPSLVYRSGVMAIVLSGGTVRAGDRVRVQPPPEPHVALRPI